MLLRWQRVEEPVSGAPGLHMVVEMLSGFEAPAGVWESDLLGARVELRAGLARLAVCPGASYGAGRTTHAGARRERPALMPIALLPREAFETWQHGSAASDPLAPGAMGVALRARR